jgi:carbon monoxide dehydrogenase subunit G
MKFRGFRTFVGRGINDVLRFLNNELHTTLKDLFAGLERLTFEDNFNSFTVQVKIKSGEEITIDNKLQVAPTKRIIVRQDGLGIITDGRKPWNNEQVSLRNHGPNDTTVTLVFLR